MGVLPAVLLALMAGGFAGSFSLPMKKTDKWAWENTWFVWAWTALFVTPLTVALITIPNLFDVISSVDLKTLLPVFLFGAGWGLGAVFFGQSIYYLGMSLAFAVSMGLTLALGALIPMFKDTSVFATQAGLVVTGGVVLMIVGVMVCSIAGNKKEKAAKTAEKTDDNARKDIAVYVKGMVLCVLSGIFNPMINFAFAFGEGIIDTAISKGASQVSSADSLWFVALSGGLLTNTVYCSILLTKNKTWPKYKVAQSFSHWPLAVMMGLTWSLSVTLYGRSAFMMGDLGKSAGWAIYLGFCIFISSFWGIVTGEWSKARGRPLNIMYAGLMLLILAIVVIGWANSLE